MKTLTIEIPEPGDEKNCFDVMDDDGRRCNGLCWDEMLGQVAALTIPHNRVGKHFRMATPEEWKSDAERRSKLYAVCEEAENIWRADAQRYRKLTADADFAASIMADAYNTWDTDDDWGPWLTAYIDEGKWLTANINKGKP